MFFSAEWTIVFGFGLEGPGCLGLVLLGLSVRSEIEQNSLENSSKQYENCE
jgi:hypothetical protein